MARDKIHRNEPLAKGNLRVLKDSSHKHGEIGLAMTAMETAIGSNGAMVLTAERTNNIVLRPTRFVDGLTAFLFGREVIGQFKDAIEASEVNHKKPKFKVFLHYYTLNLGFSFKKSRLFELIFNDLHGFRGHQVYSSQTNNPQMSLCGLLLIVCFN